MIALILLQNTFILLPCDVQHIGALQLHSNLLLNTVGNKRNLKFSCEGELLVMQGETWLEFWDLGRIIGFISFCFLICEMGLIVPDF